MAARWIPPLCGLAGALAQALALAVWPDAALPAAERLMSAGLISYVVANLLVRVPGALRRRPRPTPATWGLIGLGLAVLVVRLVMPPILLHVEFVGLKYMRMALDLTHVPTFDASYGQGGFLTQGVLAHTLGGGLRAFFVGNTLASAAAAWLAAALVARWTGSRFAAPAAVLLLAAVHPILVRAGASEDVHVVAALYGLLSIWALERFSLASEPRRADLHLAVAAGLLATCSRQFLAPMPILLLILLIERHGWRGLGRTPIRLGLLLLGVGTAVRWAVLVGGFAGTAAGGGNVFGGAVGGFFELYAGIFFPAILTEPTPLLDQAITPLPVGLAFVFGAYLVLAKKRAPRAILLAWLWLFLLTVPLCFGGIQIRYLFRLIQSHLVLLIVGVGWYAAFAWVRERYGGRLVAAGFVALTLALPGVLMARTLFDVAVDDPATRQAFLIEAAAARLPERFVLVHTSLEDLEIDGLLLSFPTFLLRERVVPHPRSIAEWRAGLTGAEAELPIVLFRGVECHSASLFELDPAFADPNTSLIAAGAADDFFRLVRHPHPGSEWVEQARRPCFGFDPPPTPLAPDLVTTVDPRGFQPGNLFYVERPFEIGFYRLPPGLAIW